MGIASLHPSTATTLAIRRTADQPRSHRWREEKHGGGQRKTVRRHDRQDDCRFKTLVAAGAKAAARCAEHPGRAVRRRRLFRFRLLWLADQDADHRQACRRGPALFGLPHHRDVLDHARGAVDRTQPSFGRRRLPRQFRFRLSRLSRQDRARGGHAGGNAAAARLSQLHGRQMARHAADRKRRHRAVRRLAAWPRLRPLLRLSRCRDRPVRAGTGVRQHPYRSARDLCRRLSSDVRPGRPVDPLHRRSHRRPARYAVADLGRARRLPCAASGAGRYHQEL